MQEKGKRKKREEEKNKAKNYKKVVNLKYIHISCTSLSNQEIIIDAILHLLTQ